MCARCAGHLKGKSCFLGGKRTFRVARKGNDSLIFARFELSEIDSRPVKELFFLPVAAGFAVFYFKWEHPDLTCYARLGIASRHMAYICYAQSAGDGRVQIDENLLLCGKFALCG